MAVITSSKTTAATKPKQRHKKARPKYQPLALEKYLPLGSLKYELTQSLDTSASASAEVDGKPSTYLPDHHVLGKHLDVLYLNGWIRVFVMNFVGCVMAAMKIYLLPDDIGRGAIPREDKKVRGSLKAIMAMIDSSADSWNGLDVSTTSLNRYQSICAEEDSLFYIFNTMQSPKPDPSIVKNRHASLAMDDILDDYKDYLGLKTQLYDYQKRSAAMMIQRETQPTLQLDSRLEELIGPTGKAFYFDRIAGQVLIEKRLYEETRGGILAETMGHGKTLISLAVVLATKGHLPQVPLEYQSEFKHHRIGNEHVGAASLKSMANRVIYQHAVPWKSYFDDLAKRGEYPENCRNFIEHNPSWYSIPLLQRLRRTSNIPTEEKRIFLSSTTLIVVPPNLMTHWQQEIDTHFEKDIFSMMVFQDDNQSLPDTRELLKLDVVLMSKTRFEDEISPRKNNIIGKLGKSGPRQFTNLHKCCCSQRRRACPIHEYQSSLLDIHFLRFIVDEGHSFASSASNRATAGLRAIHVERKWIISGTPSKGLLGLEIDMATNEGVEGHERTSAEQQQQILSKRKMRPSAELESKDLAALGHAVTNFLGLQPWANSKSQQDSASWSAYLVPDDSGVRKAGNLRSVLESLVVRHQMNEIEKDLELPCLSNKVVYLDPSYNDKVSLNLFTLVLVSNAVTSERTGQDYMFDPKNRPSLDALFKNLRHCGFQWGGFTQHDVLQPVLNSEEYLDLHKHKILAADKHLLTIAVEMGRRALGTASWKAYANTQEIGLYVRRFPRTHKKRWALCADSNTSPLLIGATHLVEAQKKVNGDIFGSDPFKNLARRNGYDPRGSNAIYRNQTSPPSSSSSSKEIRFSTAVPGQVIPRSSFQTMQKLTTKELDMHKGMSRGSKTYLGPSASGETHVNEEIGLKSAMKSTSGHGVPLPEAYDDLSKPRLIGTSSAKLSYLIDKVMELHEEEKILIFYEHDNIAYYVAQALEVLGVEHEIYATGLKIEMRSKYLEKFNKGQSTRVLLMDLKQAAHGLHVASASRVFFINPVWNPSIEAQAIKRAHRIGQDKPVFVETIVLKGTIEDRMFQRRKAMTNQEHQKAERSPLDDMTMNDIVKRANFHFVSAEEMQDEKSQLARLKVPQQIFGREFKRYTPQEDKNQLKEAEFSSKDSTPIEASPGIDEGETRRERGSESSLGKRKAVVFDEDIEDRRSKSPRPDAAVGGAGKGLLPNDTESLNASTAFEKRKANFIDELSTSESPRLNAEASKEWKGIVPSGSGTAKAPTVSKKRKASFDDELPTSKLPRIETVNTGVASPSSGQPKRINRFWKDPAKGPSAVLVAAEEIRNKWKKYLEENADSAVIRGIVAGTPDEFPAPRPSSGAESGPSAESSTHNPKKRKADDDCDGDGNAVRAKTIRFTV
ncbi:hypothetical protein MMC10_002573 [Thelotrema lepadinum]|nr:hypothetical protein [Thelotrema lepadinum]